MQRFDDDNPNDSLAVVPAEDAGHERASPERAPTQVGTARSSAPIEPVLLPAEDAFAVIGVKRTTGFALIREGRLPARKLGSRTLVEAEGLRALAMSLPRARETPTGGGTVEAACGAACELAAAGYACFPCLASKAPACPGGFKKATTDPDRLADLWRRHSGPLVGVVTGQLSGIDVLDLDSRHGAAVWWANHRSRLPPTRTHRTRSGGLHLFFRHASGLQNSAGRIARGSDDRADGGYIIWWPAAGLPVLSDGDPPSWPDWLLEPLVCPAEPPGQRVGRSWGFEQETNRPYALAALRRAVQRVATAVPGTRNGTLNAECFALCRFTRCTSPRVKSRIRWQPRHMWQG